jgi:PleD family two-component response regulator
MTKSLKTKEIAHVVQYGGEEFLILLPETEMAKASDVAERIRKTY